MDKRVSELLLRGAQHLAGSAPTENWAEAGIDSKVLTCQLFGFGTENRVDLMLPGRFPWVILTAVESPLLLLPDNQEEPAFFLIPCLPVKTDSVLLPLQLPGWWQCPALPCRGGVLPSWAEARAADPGNFYIWIYTMRAENFTDPHCCDSSIFCLEQVVGPLAHLRWLLSKSGIALDGNHSTDI